MIFLTLSRLWVVLGFLCFFSNAQFAERTESTDAIPSCSLDCLTTLLPEYGCTLANTTCVCTNAALTEQITVCALAACNVTESFRLAKYQADSCGVKNNKTKQIRQIYGLCIEYALTLGFVAARLYSRISLAVGIGPDDWLILASLVAYTADFGTGMCIPLNGFGQHTWYLETKQVERSLMYFYMSEPLYLLAITFTKLSLLLFFRRIFPNERMNRLIYAVMGFIVLTNSILILALTFQCLPFHGNWTNWEYKVAPVKCIDQYATVLTAAGMSIFHDILIILTPLPVLWRLNLNIRKKIGLVIMFSVGTFVVICSLIRLPSLLKLEHSSDPSWDQSNITIWTGLETSVGIMCACLPAVRSLVTHLFPSLKMSLNSGDGMTPDFNSRSYAGGSRALSSKQRSKLSQIQRTDSQASFFELDERERTHTTDGHSGLSKSSRESMTPQFKGEPGITTTSIGTGLKEGKGEGIVITTHIRQKRSDS